MDNIIYIILAAAVFIAMAGTLLFIATDSFEAVFEDSDEIREEDPDDWITLTSYNPNEAPNNEFETSEFEGKIYEREIING